MNFIKIDSKENQKIKFLKKLNDKKYREKYQKFFVESDKIIFDALEVDNLFDEIYLTDIFLKKNENLIDQIVKKIGLENIYLISESLNKDFSNLSAPSGIAAIYTIKLKKINQDNSILYLNNINDPGNLGSIIRTSVAFGVNNIVLDEQCADIFNFKTISAARDSIFKVNIEFDKEINFLKKIKSEIEIIATDLDGNTNLKKFTAKNNFCLVVGNEANGVSAEILKIADNRIKIEMSAAIESLNVVSATSIILYKLFTKL
ncbi:MAG: RNA methyltransferase [Candidatus Falkowbacteria bacterium]|nr:RNA methyltransferase [Candidatus Falkowbacteria bacterium]